MKEFLKEIILSPDAGHDIREKALDKYVELVLKGGAVVSGSGGELVRTLEPGNLRISAREYAEIRGLVMGNQKINAIKLIREISRLGLKESKDIAEFSDNWN